MCLQPLSHLQIRDHISSEPDPNETDDLTFSQYAQHGYLVWGIAVFIMLRT